VANIVVVGGQWGDEGKGKVVDFLTSRFNIVVRYSGGPNAGHTVRRGEKKFALHHLPSGILTEGVLCVIGNGTVIDPASLVAEIRALESQGITIKGRLSISSRAHVILPAHVRREKELEEARGEGRIGTTMKGVGPAYESKAARTGVRMVDLLDPSALRRALRSAIPEPEVESNAAALEEFSVALKEYVTDTSRLLAERMEDGTRVLFEGAQGALLDVDHGTYPFVTSSSSVAGGACTGAGVSPTRIDGVLGVFKAYATRVGGGPFPSEDRGDKGEKLRTRGNEYGTTTGRPRRCGWFDAVMARYSVRINGIDSAAMTLLDVLDGFDEIPVCTAYRYKGDRIRQFPTEPWVLEAVEPEFTVMKGWRSDTRECRSFEDLPHQAQEYVRSIEDAIECDIDMISVGPEPERSATREVSKLATWLAEEA
jgi:adenylosuccinate synthase